MLIVVSKIWRECLTFLRLATIKSASKELEEDVNLEKHRVLHEGQKSSDILRTENLTKVIHIHFSI